MRPSLTLFVTATLGGLACFSPAPAQGWSQSNTFQGALHNYRQQHHAPLTQSLPRANPTYEGRTFHLPGSEYSIHRFRYNDGLGNTYRGKTETFPGGSVRHRGSWR